ncbi:SUKH-3 domain-containing protein [Luteolibacter pohnpeiensis]|uniref:SUKH-3 domain-containing protein n=1 Tax=Luteolibacter pohnpeiensis TaxID=454153 RepID=A0A934VWI5_9BACT|nr:SUKH-3 domain-containing protein [Luteolibacter pohnpeiensis]MBK1884647.1 SUKH-3 domain-containing protein [Luteolibacter pohnpeiensis]
MKILKRFFETLRPNGNFGARFPNVVLNPLRAAGWHEGRTWEPGLLNSFVARFDRAFPPAVSIVISEFGGLHVGGGRLISFGYIDDHLCSSFAILEELVGEPLFPIGRTNIFEDDGLGVLMDVSGRVYVDGATGDEPPRDQRLDMIETDIDRFLVSIFSPGHTPEMQSWYYSLPNAE